MFIKKIVQLENHQIEYFDNTLKNNQPVIIFSPGIWEPGSRYLDLLKQITTHRVISLSFRGRGESTAPKTGFDYSDHADDLHAVISAELLNPENLIYITFSKGTSYCLAYLAKYKIDPKHIIIGDAPPIHVAQEAGYAEYWSTLKYKGMNMIDYITMPTLIGIEKESTYCDFSDYLIACKPTIHLLVATDKNAPIPSNLDTEYMNMFEQFDTVKYYNFEHSGHMFLDDEPDKFVLVIKHIIEAI